MVKVAQDARERAARRDRVSARSKARCDFPRLLVRLGVVRFVKDEKRDLLHLDETVCQRVQEQLTRHD
jgi:hypothetical protein